MRRSTRLVPLLGASLLAAVAIAPARAQDAAAVTPPAQPSINTGGDRITIGGGGVYLPDYEGSDDYRFTAAPVAIGTVKGIDFSLIGNRFSADLIPDTRNGGPGVDLELGPEVVVNFNRDSLKDIDDPRVRALGKLGTAWELGGYAGVGKTGVITSDYDKLSLTVSYRHDISGVSDSAVVTPSLTYFTPLSTKAAVGLFGSADHVGRRYAQTYFGVTPGQSLASGLAVYTPGEGWKSFTLGAVATVSITGDLLHGFKLVAGGTYTDLLGDFGDSPLAGGGVGRRGQWLGGAGIAYTF